MCGELLADSPEGLHRDRAKLFLKQTITPDAGAVVAKQGAGANEYGDTPGTGFNDDHDRRKGPDRNSYVSRDRGSRGESYRRFNLAVTNRKKFLSDG